MRLLIQIQVMDVKWPKYESADMDTCIIQDSADMGVKCWSHQF